jgi:hypothetical protein
MLSEWVKLPTEIAGYVQHRELTCREVKHVNTRFPDDLYEEATEAAIADQRPLGSLVRIAVQEYLARRKKVTYDAGGGLKSSCPPVLRRGPSTR